ncbi:MAG: hypothetical protein RMJ07_05560 [Nitrososphaerota archaeon]|nr:hypothetical protein [Candidatus Bathyarchaeota archaeon]MDW8049129.1 hypothetical protein [Nitrososphaerota archaeon]
MGKGDKIRVLPLAFESFGVRSMCTYVETGDLRILLDAGVALGPNRFGLPPHPKEYEALRERRNLILKFSGRSEIITVSHYHFDHHTPSYTDWANTWSTGKIAEKIYGGKVIFAKSYKSKVNASQRQRGWMFARTGGKNAARLEFADGRSFRFGETCIRFSEPVFHGREESELGWLLMVTIEYDGDRVLLAPDVQGPICQKTVDIILAETPRLAVIGGPPTYLTNFSEDVESFKSALMNLKILVSRIPTVILDHHILRDGGWREKIMPVFEAAESVGHRIVTAAEFLGENNRLLEASRKKLYEEEPPSKEFNDWLRLDPKKRRTVMPPI